MMRGRGSRSGGRVAAWLGLAVVAAAVLARVPRLRLRGRTVLIAGGSRGLGLCLAREFARRGARLALAARSGPELESAREELAAAGAEVTAVPCDVADLAQVEALVATVEARLGPIDVLVNDASIITVAPAQALALEEYRKAVAINFWGTVHATLAVLPGMRSRRRGAIVNITSIGGAVAVPHLLPYTCGKFAAVGFSEGMAAEARQDGIRITTVVPGLMRTGSFGNALFKGDRAAEVGWFAVASSLPLLTVSAERAARRIVRACARGERFVVVGWPAKALRLFHALFPGITVRLMELANRFALPSVPGKAPGEAEAAPGWGYRRGLARSFVTRLGDRAARRNNERPADGSGLPRA